MKAPPLTQGPKKAQTSHHPELQIPPPEQSGHWEAYRFAKHQEGRAQWGTWLGIKHIRFRKVHARDRHNPLRRNPPTQSGH